jgi:hypothetical protein
VTINMENPRLIRTRNLSVTSPRSNQLSYPGYFNSFTRLYMYISTRKVKNDASKKKNGERKIEV